MNSKMTSRQKTKKTREPKSSSLYKSVTHWLQLIRDSQEAQKEPENLGPQTEHPPSPPQPPSLLPHILLSRHNRDYRWPQKLLREPLQRAPKNTRSLANWPNHLMDPEEMNDPFLSELTDLAPVDTQKGKSVLLSLTPSEDTSDPDEQEAEEVEEDLLTITTTTWMEELPTKSPMATTSRIWSPSPRPTTSKLWGHSPESSMEIGPGPRPSSLSSSDTSYSIKESQDSSLLFDKSH
jgi:hypothetical protein